MDLIADNAHMVPVTDVGHALQFLAGPDAACGVVRVAQEEDGGLFVSAEGFEIIPRD